MEDDKSKPGTLLEGDDKWQILGKIFDGMRQLWSRVALTAAVAAAAAPGWSPIIYIYNTNPSSTFQFCNLTQKNPLTFHRNKHQKPHTATEPYNKVI